MKGIYRTESGRIVEVVKEEFNAGHHFFVDGLATTELQVLKSAAGYYIGTLCVEDLFGIYGNQKIWVPYDRDSAGYCLNKEDAEDALRTGDYPKRY